MNVARIMPNSVFNGRRRMSLIIVMLSILASTTEGANPTAPSDYDRRAMQDAVAADQEGLAIWDDVKEVVKQKTRGGLGL